MPMNEPSASADPPPELPPELTRDETPPSIATTVTPPSVECPGCGAKLRNASAGPDAKIRCLNCGIRFTPFQASNATPLAEATHESAAQPDDSKPKIREPKSAGYWLLRIPAILYAAGITCVFVGSVITTLYALFFQNSSYRGQTDGYLFALLYLPLMPLSAYYFFVTTRALARLETRTLKAAWNEKLIQNSLPGAPGSSLPFILPLAVGPIVLFIISVVKTMKLSYYYSARDVLPSGIASAACFFLAFMIDDLRQFIWRQKAMADACAPVAATRSNARSDSQFPWLGLLPAATIIAFTLFFVAIAYDSEIRYQSRSSTTLNYETNIIMSIAMFSAFGCAATFFLTGRNFHIATNAWWESAEIEPHRRIVAMMERSRRDDSARRVRIALLFFAIAGTAALVCLAIAHGPLRNVDHGLMFLSTFCAMAFCVLVARLFVQISAGEFRAPMILYVLSIAASISLPLVLLRKNLGEMTGIAIFALGIFGGNLLCLTLAQVYAEIRHWRRAQSNFWKLRKNLITPPTLPTLPNLILSATFILVTLQFSVFVCYFFYEFFGRSFSPPRWEWEVVVGIPLVAFMLHFPTIWVALMAREFMLAEEMARQLKPAPEERGGTVPVP